MKTETIAVIGLGSIGKRHAANLATLRPGAQVVKVDSQRLPGVEYATVEALLERNPLLDGALICSPHEAHLDALEKLTTMGVPCYVEKPLTAIWQWRQIPTRQRVDGVWRRASRIGMGFQYRYHSIANQLLPLRDEITRLEFTAQDALAGRYGPTVLETMASHSVDLALWLCGPASSVRLRTDGLRVRGSVCHRSGVESLYHIDMDQGPRISSVTVAFKKGPAVRLTIAPEDWMYPQCLGDWLRWALHGERSPRLATLADGIAVQDVLRQARKSRMKYEG